MRKESTLDLIANTPLLYLDKISNGRGKFTESLNTCAENVVTIPCDSGYKYTNI